MITLDENSCRIVLCLRHICRDLPLHIIFCAFQLLTDYHSVLMLQADNFINLVIFEFIIIFAIIILLVYTYCFL